MVSCGPPEWCRGLRHCIAVLKASLQARVQFWETHEAVHKWPSVIRVKGGFGRPGCPCPIALWRLLWRAGRMHVDTVASCTVSSDTLVLLASRLSKQCVKKQCGLAGSCFGGRMALDLRLSRVRTGVAVM